MKHCKLNFDGASKGNLGDDGIGRAIRNYRGEIINIYRDYIWHERNNVTKLEALIQGLLIAQNRGLLPPIAKENSQLIIYAMKKIHYGSPLMKCSFG